MDILKNEILNLSQIVQILSYELTVLQDFMNDKYGSAFETFRSNHSESTSKIDNDQQRDAQGSQVSTSAGSLTISQGQGCKTETLDGETSIQITNVESCENVEDSLADYQSDEIVKEIVNMQCDDSSDPDVDNVPLFSGASKRTKQRKPIWKKFKVSRLPNGKLLARCKKCKMSVSSKAERLEQHYQKCKKLFSDRQVSNEIDEQIEIVDKDELNKQIAAQLVSLKMKMEPPPVETTTHQPSVSNSGNISHGRKLDPVWSYFNVSENEAGKKTVICKRCGEKVSSKVERVRRHFIKCEEIDKEIEFEDPLADT